MKRSNYEMPVGRVRVIKDFLPPPSVLFAPVETVKVTIYLSKDSVDFFKKEAKKVGAKYQRLIRATLDAYAVGSSDR